MKYKVIFTQQLAWDGKPDKPSKGSTIVTANSEDNAIWEFKSLMVKPYLLSNWANLKYKALNETGFIINDGHMKKLCIIKKVKLIED